MPSPMLIYLVEIITPHANVPEYQVAARPSLLRNDILAHVPKLQYSTRMYLSAKYASNLEHVSYYDLLLKLTYVAVVILLVTHAQ